ncbi:MAG: hypothetical protein ACRDMI_06730 [Streptosporangiaceae bacterium]
MRIRSRSTASSGSTAVKGFDFQVLDPPELIPVLYALAERLRRAAAS